LGCGNGSSAAISIRIHEAPPLDSADKCPIDPNPVPLVRGPNGPTTLRLTWRRSGGGPLLCDAVVPLEGDSRLVGVPSGMTELGEVDLLVEAFRGGPAGAELVASGQTLNIDLSRGGEVAVMLAPRDRFRCTPGRLARGRAFHSATTLPTGEVLLIGGLVPNAADPAVDTVNLLVQVGTQPTGGFFATSSIELYDPQRGEFAEITVDGLTPRAFHEAYLLPAPTAEGAFEILLVGGVTVIDDPMMMEDSPAMDGLRESTVTQPFRMVPAPNAVGAPTEVLTYDPRDGSTTVRILEAPGAFAARMLGAATRPPSLGDDPTYPSQLPPLLAGGFDDYAPSGAMPPATTFATFEEADLVTGMSIGDDTWTMQQGVRMGASVTRLAPDLALVWGGNLGSASGSEQTEIGEIVRALGTPTPTTAFVTYDTAGILPSPRAFHTATALDAANVLILGGFSLGGGSTGDPAAPFGQIVTLTGVDEGIVLTNVNVATGGPRVGYHDAVPLLGGDVLVTGGNPATGTVTEPCPDSSTGTHLCSVNDAYRWRRATQTLEHLMAIPDDKGSGGLLVSRWGHRSAVLLDSTVLITGGFTWFEGVSLNVVREGELYNPRTEAHDLGASSLEGLAPRVPGDLAHDMAGEIFSQCPTL
jgi:hypothetical protein